MFLTTGLVISLCLLGNWQIKRLSWKNGLIEKVNSRAYNDPRQPPAEPVTYEEHAYLRVKVSGRYMHDRSILVKAVTDIGLGYWVMTPLLGEVGNRKRTIWINRGFVPQSFRSTRNWEKTLGQNNVIGLLRISEPEGTLLEKNNPENNRWYSRDIAAMSRKAGLTDVAPYFLDQVGAKTSASWPRPGMTILKFNNPHLVYAITWYVMALLLLGTSVYLIARPSHPQNP